MASDVHSESETVEPAVARTTESETDGEQTPPATAETVESAGETGGDGEGTVAPRPRRVAVLLCVAAAALLIDVVTKILVVSKLTNHAPVQLPGGFMDLNLTRNSGAAFSIGQTQTWAFTLIATAVVVVIVRISRNLRSLPWACALGLLLGGALGNLGDRIFREPKVFEGHVVDFLQFHTFPLINWDFPVFNLADSAICVGGALMVLLSFLGIQPDGTRHVAEPRTSAEPDAGEVPEETSEQTPKG